MKILGKLFGGDSRVSKDERPPTHELRKIEVIDEEDLEDSDPYVEIFLEIHKQMNSAGHTACEGLTIEYHPHRDDYSGLFVLDREPAVVRILQQGRLTDEETERYKIFGAVVGRLSYYEP